MKKFTVLLLMLSLVVSCNGQSTRSDQDTDQTFIMEGPDGKIREHKKIVTIYLSSEIIDKNADGTNKYGLTLYDANDDHGNDTSFTTYYVTKPRKQNEAGIIMWETVRNSGVEIDRIIPMDNSQIFEGAIDNPPFVIVLSKEFLESLPEDGIREKYSIEYKINKKPEPVFDPYIDIKPPQQ